MRLRNLILLLLAVVLAGGTALLARSYLAAQRAAQVAHVAPPPPRPERPILVARADLARGHLLKAGDLGWQVWPDNAITPAYIKSGGKVVPQSFSGWVVVKPIAEGAPVTPSMMISPGSGGFLAAVLQPGLRAIQVTTTSLPAGTQPGDRVDLMVYFGLPKEAKGYDGNNAVETVLRGLRILQIGTHLETAKPARKPPETVSGPVIFEVTPRQAEIVTLAERMGTLTFVLDSLRRGPEETASNDGSVVLAAAHDPQTDPRDPPAGTGMSAPPAIDGAGSDMSDTRQPTYLTDAAVNRFLRMPVKEVTVPVTILRGGQLGKPAEVPVLLQCSETACSQFNQMPTRLVGTDGQATGK